MSVDDPAPAVISSLSLHDALPIWLLEHPRVAGHPRQIRPAARGRVAPGLHLARILRRLRAAAGEGAAPDGRGGDRKSTRLNYSHLVTSYAVFCLKTK